MIGKSALEIGSIDLDEEGDSRQNGGDLLSVCGRCEIQQRVDLRLIMMGDLNGPKVDDREGSQQVIAKDHASIKKLTCDRD